MPRSAVSPGRSFSDARMRDPALRQLMQRIRISENKDFTRDFPAKLLTRIEVVTRSGQRLVETASYPKGHAKNPMSDSDVESKFTDLSRDLLTPAGCDALLRVLWNVDAAEDLSQVIELVRVAS